MRIGLRAAIYFVALVLSKNAFAQDATQGRALGVVTKVDTDARLLTIKADQGGEISVSLDPKANFRQVAPGETNLQNATAITLADIHTGDRVLARGKAGANPNSIAATLVVVMSQSDIANKQAAERADWDRRGVTGIVTDATPDQITINVRALEGVKPLVITAAPNAIIRRYAPDSVKFTDAKPSKLADIRKGDQVRARGDKTPDGMKMTADEIVSGQFKMIAGLVTAIDANENVIRINNIETKKPMTVRISADSSVKKLPLQLSQLIANRLHGVTETGAAGRASSPGNTPPIADGRGGFPGRGAFTGGGGRGAADLQQMIDRTPAIKIADLMMGDAIIVSSTVGANADQVTAIILLAGVEPILTKPGTREMSLGDWNLGGGGDLGGIGQ